VRGYVDFLRGTPLLVQLVLLFYLPAALGVRFPALVAGVIGLALYYGAYITEIVRGGLASVPRGHLDAARALGMPRFTTFRHIVLPQVLAIVVPPLAGQFTAVVKGTSLLSVITVFELTSAGHEISVRTVAPVETWIVVAFIYLGLNGIIAGGSVLLERRLRVGYR
jgi:polar amino acid transport system permease protein